MPTSHRTEQLRTASVPAPVAQIAGDLQRIEGRARRRRRARPRHRPRLWRIRRCVVGGGALMRVVVRRGRGCRRGRRGRRRTERGVAALAPAEGAAERGGGGGVIARHRRLDQRLELAVERLIERDERLDVAGRGRPGAGGDRLGRRLLGGVDDVQLVRDRRQLGAADRCDCLLRAPSSRHRSAWLARRGSRRRGGVGAGGTIAPGSGQASPADTPRASLARWRTRPGGVQA
jgi:hypothetical protein